ncbi:cysteine desulfurase family protein [Turicibacter sanguinis]|uniref:cysteine desulfurase family protein n=1 Tax=Turicibacter sanguinis TaxID=154288 RepID=UPI0018ABE426|nr:cysteine desulfurase family protein [Turicibacter sanguinis]MDB8556969.1 cysteine desulfurase family protein [Turicibacter sanguinis]MDB8559744.1 cysteine desulfurase family protein [Turicibacter sanguinis]
MIYFDNAATTEVSAEVLAEMLPFLKEHYGNPTSKYYPLALEANQAIKNASAKIAECFNVSSDEVIYTSGATESNNMIIKGIAFSNIKLGGHFITTKVEHSSVLKTYQYLETLGFSVTYLDVDKFGRINCSDLLASITDDTLLCSIIWANNEVGSLNDIKRISEICNSSNIPLHVDATQVIGKYKFTLDAYPGIKFLTGSGHKIHGPKGIGFTLIRKDKDGILPSLTPLLHGGGQQNDYRSGTIPTYLIVGLAKAIEIVVSNIDDNVKYLKMLEQIFLDKIEEVFGNAVHINSDKKNKIYGLINLQIKGINNELLLKKISDYIAASTGSACSVNEPSHVLKSMGYTLDEIRNSIRFSLSINNTIEEIDQFISIFK